MSTETIPQPQINHGELRKYTRKMKAGESILWHKQIVGEGYAGEGLRLVGRRQHSGNYRYWAVEDYKLDRLVKIEHGIPIPNSRKNASIGLWRRTFSKMKLGDSILAPIKTANTYIMKYFRLMQQEGVIGNDLRLTCKKENGGWRIWVIDEDSINKEEFIISKNVPFPKRALHRGKTHRMLLNLAVGESAIIPSGKHYCRHIVRPTVTRMKIKGLLPKSFSLAEGFDGNKCYRVWRRS